MKTAKIPDSCRSALLSDYTSRPNKLWLVISWQHFRDFYVEWKWQGEPYRSRMMFQFSVDGPWVVARSFEEDRLPTYKFGEEKKK